MVPRTRWALLAVLLSSTLPLGCGTTKWSDTKRTATEQLLISDAMDRAVSRMDFRAVAGKKVYLDDGPLSDVTDAEYLVSLLRQHMLANGCRVMEKRDEADYVVEVRAGAVGTDRREVTFGVPATQAISSLPVATVVPAIPEMPLANKTEQKAVVKIALFAYNRKTGRPVWQSGTVPIESTAKNLWLLGAGPFQRGTIYEGTEFVGREIEIPLIAPGRDDDQEHNELAVSDEAYFAEPVEPDDSPAPKPLTAAQLAKRAAKPAPKTAPQKPAPKPEVAETKPKESKPAAKDDGVVPATHEAEIRPETGEDGSKDDENAPKDENVAPKADEDGLTADETTAKSDENGP
jgi:hypothetical protein